MYQLVFNLVDYFFRTGQVIDSRDRGMFPLGVLISFDVFKRCDVSVLVGFNPSIVIRIGLTSDIL